MDKQLWCKDCGDQFSFTAEAQNLYRQRNWRDPIRCEACQIKRRNDPYYGWQHTMSTAQPARHRHTYARYSGYYITGIGR